MERDSQTDRQREKERQTERRKDRLDLLPGLNICRYYGNTLLNAAKRLVAAL